MRKLRKINSSNSLNVVNATCFISLKRCSNNYENEKISLQSVKQEMQTDRAKIIRTNVKRQRKEHLRSRITTVSSVLYPSENTNENREIETLSFLKKKNLLKYLYLCVHISLPRTCNFKLRSL